MEFRASPCCLELCAGGGGTVLGLEAAGFRHAGLVSAGLPCTPHSRGGRQLGAGDSRYLWAEALRIVAEARPRSIMLETSDAILTRRRAVLVAFREDRAAAAF